MKKIIPIVLFFIAAGVAFYLSYSSKQRIENFDQAKKTRDKQQKIEDTKKPTNATTYKSGSIMDLLKNKESLRCTYSKNSQTYSISGTLYTDGTNARTNTTTESSGIKRDSNTIFTGDDIYIWEVGMATGVKMNIAKIKSTLVETTTSINNGGVGSGTQALNEVFDYNCSTWAPMQDMFLPPNNVTFSDITDAMQKINNNPCLLCDTLKDENKVLCKQSYKCN